MKKLCFFLMSGLPIPAVKGGAIETLLQIFIDQNEINQLFDITVLSIGDSEASKLTDNYKFTHFVYFPKSRIDALMGKASRIIYRLFRFVTPYSVGLIHALKYLKSNQQFDVIINETWKVYISPLLTKHYPKEKILLHLHRKGEPQKGDITRRIDSNIGNLVAVSNFVADDWMSITGRDISKTFVLHNCCDTRSISRVLDKNEKTKLRASLGIADEKVVLYFGRITNEKGVIELVDAFDQIKNENCVLLIVGGSSDNKTKYEMSLDKRISESSKRIIRTGYVDNEKLYMYYNIADLVVLPSTCPDAAPLTVIEALTAGKAIVTTNNGGIPEYVEDSACSVEVDESFTENLAECISLHLIDDKLRTELENRAKVRAEGFSPERYYSDFSNIINAVSSDNKE